jgi:hypothetical protein
MKKQYSLYFALIIILIASQACSAGGATPSATTDEQTSPLAATISAQESGSIDGPPGPETIDLTSSALYIQSSAPEYRFESTIHYSGLDTTGVAKEVTALMALEVQTQPQPAQRLVLDYGTGSSETTAIDDGVFMVISGECSAFPDAGPQDQSAFMPNLQQAITGQAPRVESGIEVNGFVTDKYELSSENLVTDDELISAFVYVARSSGFITLFELQGRTKTDLLTMTDLQWLDPNQMADFTRTDNYIPMEDGSLNIAIPASCENQAGLVDEFPVMDGAIASSTGPEFLFYQIEKPAAEVADFYRAEMPNRGWELTEDTTIDRVETASGSTGPVVTLVFTKDGKNFIVKADGGGPVTGVTIKEE